MQHFYPLLQQFRHRSFPVRLGGFLIAVLVGTLPIAGLAFLFPAFRSLAWIPLYIWLLALLQIWNRVVRQRNLWQIYGLTPVPTLGIEVVMGLGMGFLGLMLMFGLEGSQVG